MAKKKVETCSFGVALELLKNGKRVARKGWNGKKMFIERNIGYENLDSNPPVEHGEYLMIKATDGMFYPWTPSQQDLFAEDWIYVGEVSVVES